MLPRPRALNPPFAEVTKKHTDFEERTLVLCVELAPVRVEEMTF